MPTLSMPTHSSPRCDFGVYSIGTVGPSPGASLASLQSKSLLYPPEWSWLAGWWWGFGLPLPDPADTACFFPPSLGLPAHRVERSCWIYCISLNGFPLSLTRTLIMQPCAAWPGLFLKPPSFLCAVELDSILSMGLSLESFMLYELLVDTNRPLQVFCHGTWLLWPKSLLERKCQHLS